MSRRSNKAEDTILAANIRIGQEIQKVEKRPGPGPRKHVSGLEHVSEGREAIDIPRASRSRLMKLANTPQEHIEALTANLRAAGRDVSVGTVLDAMRPEDKKQERAETLQRLAAKALPQELFPVLYADPP